MIAYQNGKIMEKEQELEVMGSYDVIVAGGGVAGVAAALSAAKREKSVLLLEKSNQWWHCNQRYIKWC